MERALAAYPKVARAGPAPRFLGKRDPVASIEARLRTNSCAASTSSADAAGRRPKDYISFKLDSQKIDELPLPRPLVEIFVYSPRIEGMPPARRPVARGGIRWSDRREDFRTEILGLMKAQMVKNAVIVPVGSKGGFL
jgi:glutamate dehydrogenase